MWSLGYTQIAENEHVETKNNEILNSTEKILPKPENLIANKSYSGDESDSEIADIQNNNNQSSINPVDESEIKNQSNNEIDEDFVMIEKNQLIDKKTDDNLTLKPSKKILFKINI